MSAIIPVQDVKSMAQAIATSSLFGIKDANQAFALMLVAQSEGRHPASIAQEYDIIQGRPAIKAVAALSRFQAAGGRIQWLQRSDEACEARFVHSLGGEVSIAWSMERAKAAGLTGKASWRQYPTQMLAARVIAEGVRACFPACLSGFYLSEEVADFDTDPPQMQAKPTQNTTNQPKTAEIITPNVDKPNPKTREQRIDDLINLALDSGLYNSEITEILGTAEWKSATDDAYKALKEAIIKTQGNQ
jgi:hypothetical protein